ncbi:hypothetical protein F8S12_09980 [Nostoc sp. WHI]|nr:hypothetical protein [Nostoc sp. WHI]
MNSKKLISIIAFALDSVDSRKPNTCCCSNSTTSVMESDRYGTLLMSANQLLRVMELKQLAKKLGFSHIKPENKVKYFFRVK